MPGMSNKTIFCVRTAVPLEPSQKDFQISEKWKSRNNLQKYSFDLQASMYAI